MPAKPTIRPDTTDNGTMYGQSVETILAPDEGGRLTAYPQEQYDELMSRLDTDPDSVSDAQVHRLIWTTGLLYPTASPTTSPMYERLRAVACSRGLA